MLEVISPCNFFRFQFKIFISPVVYCNLIYAIPHSSPLS
uniref:Uncharacterized protein n=1 Tax=Arundo donax TaxID=35708 RepID=A0A0A9FTV8_ARUDO